MVRDEVRALRPPGGGKGFAVRFETLPGEQAQVDFAQFRVSFTACRATIKIRIRDNQDQKVFSGR